MFRGLRKILKIYTLKDYLTKDENGVTLLENLLKEGKELSYKNEYKLRKSIEAGYIYAKNNKTLFGFEYTEKQLFSYIDGKLFIEYLISTNTNTYRMIETIKNNIKIVDIIVDNNEYLIEYLNKRIIKKLITKDKNGNYLIEKYINNEKAIKRLINVINDKDIIINLCNKYKRIDLLKYCNEKVLMSKYNKETIFNYLIKNNESPYNINSIKNKKYIKFLLNREYYEYLCSLDETALLLKIKGNKTLLQILLDKELIKDLNFIIKERKTINILNKYNRLDLAKTIDINILKSKSKRKFTKECLYEYLLNKGYKPKFYESFLTTEEDLLFIIDLLYKRKEFQLIGNSLDQKYFFYEIEKGIPLIDKLLEESVDIDFRNNVINNIDIVKKIFNKNRIDLLVNVNLNILLNMADNNKTYLDYVLESVKNKSIKFNLNNIKYFKNSVNVLAKFYLRLANHNMIEYVDKLEVEDLLKEYNGKRLLDELLELDKELTINKILSEEVKSDLKIGIILKDKGINLNKINIPTINKKFDKDYLIEKENTYGIGPIQNNGDYLLNKLQELFINDKESDKEIINALVLGYRQALITNYDVFIKELENLIKIKENNKNFKYIKHNEDSYFNRANGSVFSDNNVVNVIMHETGHALHYYLADSKMPDNYIEVVNRVRNNKELLNKADEISDKYNKIIEKIEELVEKKYNKMFNNYYNEHKIKEIEMFLEKSKLEKKEEFKNLGIDEETLDVILNNTFTSNEFINTQKRKFIEEQVDSIIRTEYGNIMAISDILDGIFEGELHSEVLLNKDNKLIKSSAGHGISYYSCNYEKTFREMIANFSTISKSINANEMLSLLRDTIGDELFNLISDYYYKNIIGIENSKSYKRVNK